MVDFYIKQGDLKPEIQAVLQNSDGSAADLTNATGVQFVMVAKGTFGSPKVSAAATIVTAASGLVKYPWAGTDTDTAGDYDAEWEVTYTGGGIETFPNDGYMLVRVTQQLGSA